MSIPDSPVVISADFTDPGQSLIGALQTLTREGARGWLVNRNQPLWGQKIVITIADYLIGRGSISQARPDIAQKWGVTEQCGFDIVWEYAAQNIRMTSFTYPVILEMAGTRYFFANRPSITGVKLFNLSSRNLSVEPLFSIDALKEMFASYYLDEPALQEEDVKLIAYYLPQYHPIPENDEWWGPGFTEWTNVSQARPLFPGHYQPHLPGELGFYDLRSAEVREAQAQMARQYGIYGFCYYYYWFQGRKILDRPLREVFESGSPDFPFCICWANESWSRSWDGSENVTLIRQEHSLESDVRFIQDVIPLFRDPRYIRVNGAPLLLIYKPKLLQDAAATTASWRKICADAGIPRLFLGSVEAMEEALGHPAPPGFDVSVQFPPHGTVCEDIDARVEGMPASFAGKTFNYEACVRNMLQHRHPYKHFPGVMPGFDNTPRRKQNAHIFLNATPEQYEIWLRAAIDYARESLPEGERFVFINAWNEWAEGAHLEPDQRDGRAWLEATRRALRRTGDWPTLLEYARQLPELSGTIKDRFLGDIGAILHRLELERSLYEKSHKRVTTTYECSPFKAGAPSLLNARLPRKKGVAQVERINGASNPGYYVVKKGQPMYLEGWFWGKGCPSTAFTPAYVLLVDSGTQQVKWYAFISGREKRTDVSRHFWRQSKDNTEFSGLGAAFDLQGVEAGKWQLAFMAPHANALSLVYTDVIVEVQE